jgi:hypothetical protein
MSRPVEDAPPPRLALRFVNPVILTLLRTPLSRAMGGLAILQFAGRRSGSIRRVVVGWHDLDGQRVVFTPASWRANFAEPHDATVRWRGTTSRVSGTLDLDPGRVAAAIDRALATGTSARGLALRVTDGHHVTADDVVHVHRGMIRFIPLS